MTSALDLDVLPLSYPLKQAAQHPGLYAAQASFRAARGRSGDSLVIHLALDGTAPLTPKEHDRMLRMLAEFYFKTSGSSTTAMRTVAERLNDFLVERNQRGANRSLQSAGLLTQAVFRGDHLYLAQCGPTHAFLINKAVVTHYHLSNLAWRGLGFNKVPEIRYHQVEVSPGDALLVSADPPAAWSADRLAQLTGLSLEGMVLNLVAGVDHAIEAGLVRLEPGSGKLNTVDPKTIKALQLKPEEVDWTRASEVEMPEGSDLSPTAAAAEKEPPADSWLYLREASPSSQALLDEPTAIQAGQALQESSPSGEEIAGQPLPQVYKFEMKEVEEEVESLAGVEKSDAATVTQPESGLFPSGLQSRDQDLPLQAKNEPGAPARKGFHLPRWIWSLLVGALLLGIAGFVFLIRRDLSGFSPGWLDLVQPSQTQLIVKTHTPSPSFTLPPTETHTPPPTPTTTPLPPTLTLTPSPTPKYRIGSTQVSPVDGMVMVFVPAGTFLMGADEGDPNALRDERPQHTVNLGAFWIDRTEVTNGQYTQCVAARECRIPYSLTSYTHNPYFNVPEFSEFPVIFVSWNDAQDYCQWAGRRLPTEAEWEKAARGPDGRIYPWGDELDCDLANYQDCLGDTAEAASYPEGASPYGALNLAGNVWEWVADWYYFAYYDITPLDYPTGPQSGAYRVIRGGSWNDDPVYLRTSSRYWYYPDNARFSVGFRCAVSEFSSESSTGE